MLTTNEARDIVEDAGGIYVGFQKTHKPENMLILFNDPTTGSTLSVKAQIASAKRVKAKMMLSRLRFTKIKIDNAVPVSSDLCIEVADIRNEARKLLAPLCFDACAIEQLMSVLGRLDVLGQYLKTR